MDFKKIVRRKFYGLLIWVVPFIVSFFIWDIKTNAPSVSQGWFNAIMTISWAVAYGFAVYKYFGKKQPKKKVVKDAWMTAVTWYLELIVLDCLVLVFGFGMLWANYFPLLVVYLNTFVVTVVIGYMLKRR